MSAEQMTSPLGDPYACIKRNQNVNPIVKSICTYQVLNEITSHTHMNTTQDSNERIAYYATREDDITSQ